MSVCACWKRVTFKGKQRSSHTNFISLEAKPLSLHLEGVSGEPSGPAAEGNLRVSGWWTHDSPEFDRIQGVAGGPVHRHLAHDEQHDLGSLVVWQVSSKKAWQRSRETSGLFTCWRSRTKLLRPASPSSIKITTSFSFTGSIFTVTAWQANVQEFP